MSTDIVGATLSHVWRGYGSAIFLEFGALTPRTRRDGTASEPNGEFTLMIEWSWRIESGTSILCGSFSDKEIWPSIFEQLLGLRVREINLFGRLPEIDVSLCGGRHILSFSTTEGDPKWALSDKRSKPHTWTSVVDGELFIGN
ncbi:MAG: hypothetical protein AAF160_14690 [Pseudomonadota bacterium]